MKFYGRFEESLRGPLTVVIDELQEMDKVNSQWKAVCEYDCQSECVRIPAEASREKLMEA